MKKLSILLLVALLAGVVAGCAAPPAAPATGKGKLKLTSAAKPVETPPESYLTKAFGLIESMTLAKADIAAIIEAVLPVFAAGGKTNKLVVNSRVKQLMEIVAVEHGLKDKK
jgi:PBP1b-binding outer membrane lipoprotein LpoB